MNATENINIEHRLAEQIRLCNAFTFAWGLMSVQQKMMIIAAMDELYPGQSAIIIEHMGMTTRPEGE